MDNIEKFLKYGKNGNNFEKTLLRNSEIVSYMKYNFLCDHYLVLLGLFVFAKDVTKTKYLQILTTVMRWTAFIIMITLAGLRLSRGIIFRPPVSDFSGVPNLFGVCVYSFMCHHSLPSLGNIPFLSASFYISNTFAKRRRRAFEGQL